MGLIDQLFWWPCYRICCYSKSLSMTCARFGRWDGNKVHSLVLVYS